MYKLATIISLDKKFKKFRKKDKDLLHLINRKVQDILNDPHRFKPLRKKTITEQKMFMDCTPTTGHISKKIRLPI